MLLYIARACLYTDIANIGKQSIKESFEILENIITLPLLFILLGCYLNKTI